MTGKNQCTGLGDNGQTRKCRADANTDTDT